MKGRKGNENGEKKDVHNWNPRFEQGTVLQAEEAVFKEVTLNLEHEQNKQQYVSTLPHHIHHHTFKGKGPQERARTLGNVPSILLNSHSNPLQAAPQSAPSSPHVSPPSSPPTLASLTASFLIFAYQQAQRRELRVPV